MDIPSTRTSFADLYINDTFMGVYALQNMLMTSSLKKIVKKITEIYISVTLALYYVNGDDPEAYKFESNGRRAYDLKPINLMIILICSFHIGT